MPQFFKDLFTGIDGESFDVGRVLWVVMCIAFVIYHGYDLWHNAHFDSSSFGLNAGGLLAGGGIGVGAKSKTEPADGKP